MACSGLKKEENYLKDITRISPGSIAWWALNSPNLFGGGFPPTRARLVRDGYATITKPDKEAQTLSLLCEIGEMLSQGKTLADVYPLLAGAYGRAKEALRVAPTEKYFQLLKEKGWTP